MMRSPSLRPCLVFALAIAAGCATSSSQLRAPASSPLRLLHIEVQEQGSARTLASGERLQPEQSFGLTLSSDVPLHLYVLLEHADSRRELFHPRPGAAPSPVSGAQRLPASGDWFRLRQVQPGDRLCLIGSEQPLGQLTCQEDRAGPPTDRGEDTPPPPPSPPPQEKTERKEPPDDKPDSRGRGQWVILLPL